LTTEPGTEPTMTDPGTAEIARYASDKRRSGRIRRIVLLALLLLVLAWLIWSALYYAANKKLPLPGIDFGPAAIEGPQYLYSISGPEGDAALRQPIGVAVSEDDRVYTVDAASRSMKVYNTDGDYLFGFGALASEEATHLALPARVAIGPDGNVYVTDRRLQGLFIFTPDGEFIREFDPGETLAEWGPLAVGFDETGAMYVADVGFNRKHQIVVFDAAGAEIARWGDTVKAERIEDAPGGFNYPNGIAVSNDRRVFVSDMSNRRLQVFTPEGEWLEIIGSSGSPLGLVFDDEQRLYVVDPFAHMVDIYRADGVRIAGFGGPGISAGKFRFPSDISLDRRGRMFVSDRENNQIQVWGWPSGIVPPVELPTDPAKWALCLSPLALLLIPLLRRRRAIVAASDFIEGMIDIEAVPAMDDRRFRWVVPDEVYAEFQARTVQGIELGRLLDNRPHSPTDVADVMERTKLDHLAAVLLTMGDRDGRLATEDETLAEAARAFGVEVIDRQRFLDEYASGRRTQTNGTQT
jgi:sugar lactone lactonase YvrE